MAKISDHLTRFGSDSHDRLSARRDLVSPVMAAVSALFLTFMLLMPSHSLAANRSLTLYFTHTKETATITYKRNGKFDAAGLRKLNRFLRDWRRNESTTMDPALFDLIWQVYRDTGAKKPIHVVSAYRSPATNNMLRSRSRGVAKNSRHTQGQAMDFYLPGVKTSAIRNAGLRLQAGGVGYYPNSRSPFVHIDTGNVRHWPRMSSKQLARVFPKGKTVHVPRDGKPFSGYKVAKAQVAKRKANMVRTSRSVKRFTQVAKAAPAVRKTFQTKPTVQVAKATQGATKESSSLISRLLNRTPKEPPKPTFNTAQIEAPQVQPEEEQVRATIMPLKLAALPKPPLNRPIPAPTIELAADAVAEQAVEATETLPEAIPTPEAETPTEKPVLLASLPKARPAQAPASFQLASAEPLTALPAEDTVPAKATEAPVTPATPAAAETPVAPVPAPETPEALKMAETPEAPEAQTVAEAPAVPAPAPKLAAASDQPLPAESATDVLNRLAETVQPEQANEPSSRIAYASSEDTFMATLPSAAPRPRLSAQEATGDLGTLPKKADRTQLASRTPAAAIPATAEGDLATLPRPGNQTTRSQTQPRAASASARPDRLARLTFAYGPSGMAHFAHMKQSTRTATFARLSRPIPNNLAALVSKPGSIIDQTFSHRPSQLVGAENFAGAAIARMSVRSFN